MSRRLLPNPPPIARAAPRFGRLSRAQGGACGLLLALLLLFIGACADEAADAPQLVAGLEPQCEIDSDCPLGTICRQPYQICVTSLHNPSVVSIAATPPADSGMAAVHIANLSFSVGNMLTLSYPETVTITGVVRVAGNLAEASVPSTIVAVAKDEIIKGTNMRSQTSATDAGYTLQLIKGVDYTLSIKINDADPPRPAHRIDVNYSKSTSGVAITLPALADYPVLTGRVYRVIDGNKQPLKAAQVTALHVESHEQCTSQVTNNLGSYELRCPLMKGPYNVLVSPTEDGPIIPSFTALFGEQSYKEDEIFVIDDTDLPDIVIGEQSRDTEATVEVLDSYGAAVVAIPVTVESTLEPTSYWRNAVVRHTGLSNLEGRITFNVLEGLYRVMAAPHPSSPLAIENGDDWDVKAFPNKTLTLTNKGNLTGTLLSFLGDPVVEAEIVARTTWVNKATQSTTVREYVTMSDDSGQFSLPLDAFSYAVKIVPPESSGLPRTWLNGNVEIGPKGIKLGEILLAPPSLVEGNVLAPPDTPIPFVSVDLYSQPETGPAHLLARGIADEDGFFHLILTCPK